MVILWNFAETLCNYPAFVVAFGTHRTCVNETYSNIKNTAASRISYRASIIRYLLYSSCIIYTCMSMYSIMNVQHITTTRLIHLASTCVY